MAHDDSVYLGDDRVTYRLMRSLICYYDTEDVELSVQIELSFCVCVIQVSDEDTVQILVLCSALNGCGQH